MEKIFSFLSNKTKIICLIWAKLRRFFEVCHRLEREWVSLGGTFLEISSWATASGGGGSF